MGSICFNAHWDGHIFGHIFKMDIFLRCSSNKKITLKREGEKTTVHKMEESTEIIFIDMKRTTICVKECGDE